MAQIHATAVLDGEIDLAEDVSIGPYCVLTGLIRIGAGSRLFGNVYLQGPLMLGAGNVLYPFVCLGFAPQSLGYDPSQPGQGLVIGDGNTFREGVTIHRAMTGAGPTRVGDRNYCMANSHIGHDAQIGSHCVFANGTLFGGHVHIGDRVVTGGNAAVHQFCRVGRGAMLSGVAGLSRDLPPYFMLTGINIAGSINLIGLRRSGLPRSSVDDVRWVYRTLYRRGLSLSEARAELESARDERPIVAEYLEFLDCSERGLCPADADDRRGKT
ncbi:MAG: acyl-ACP--UDP-N-acetylglucosamine O-acyltransferase [Gammaproteobacteria bacterium]